MEETHNEKSLQLETRSIGKLLLTYSIPSIISMVVVALYSIVDRVYIGQGVGPYAISGLAITLPLMSLVTAVGTLIGVGAAARISIVLGMKDINWARKILGNALILTCVLSALLISLSMFYMDDILPLFGGTDKTIVYAKKYLQFVIPASLFTNLTFSFCNMMRASGYPLKSMFVILTGVVLNIILDPIFIFGLKMGIEGAAIATLISMFASSVLVMLHFTNPKSFLRFHSHCFKLEKRIIRNIISIGMAPFLMNVTACTVNIIMNNSLLTYGGELAIGAYGIINSYGLFAVMVVMGLCQGMQPIVGYNYGAEKMKRVKDALLLTIRVATLIMTSGFLLCELLTPALARAFTSDPELIGLTVHGMRISFAVFWLIGFQIVVSNFFQSISKAKKAIFMTLSRQVIFLIPALFLCSRLWGLTGVWVALPISDFLACVVAFLFLAQEKKVFYARSAKVNFFKISSFF